MTRCDSRLSTSPSVLPDGQLLSSLGWRTGYVKVTICVTLAEKRICKAILVIVSDQP